MGPEIFISLYAAELLICLHANLFDDSCFCTSCCPEILISFYAAELQIFLYVCLLDDYPVYICFRFLLGLHHKDHEF